MICSAEKIFESDRKVVSLLMQSWHVYFIFCHIRSDVCFRKHRDDLVSGLRVVE